MEKQKRIFVPVSPKNYPVIQKMAELQDLPMSKVLAIMINTHLTHCIKDLECKHEYVDMTSVHDNMTTFRCAKCFKVR